MEILGVAMGGDAPRWCARQVPSWTLCPAVLVYMCYDECISTLPNVSVVCCVCAQETRGEGGERTEWPVWSMFKCLLAVGKETMTCKLTKLVSLTISHNKMFDSLSFLIPHLDF